MNVNRTDRINTGLLCLSFLAALFVPFHLFLFAYAVLGPLHYLTEITWLKKHDFFSRSKYDGIVLAFIGLLVTVIAFAPSFSKFISGGSLMFFAFWVSLVFFLVKSLFLRGLLLVILVISTYVFSGQDIGMVLFSVLLPTVIHVYVFTGLFMLYGAVKSRSIVGFTNVVLLIVFGSLFFILPHAPIFGPSVYVIQTYLHSFVGLHYTLGEILGFAFLSTESIFFSPFGVSIMRFIAFAYTYHYLNWFSKTSVIGWQESAKPYKFFIYSIWLMSVLLYGYSYGLGLMVLYFLSMTHVILEFPLNHKTTAALLLETKRRV